MKRCPITLESISEQEHYSIHGLKLLSPQLTQLAPLTLTAAEQRLEAIALVGKMSIQGIQPKLSAILKIKEGRFAIVDRQGRYILKPQSEHYPELPENEAVTMSLAALVGLIVPVHGLVYAKDQSMTYFIKRFDRIGHRHKIAVEDFAQLSQKTRDTKYNSSMEQVAKIIENYCTFPRIEVVTLLKLVLFNFLIGNEDMHLKNFSLIRQNNKITLSPAYDLLNTTIVQATTKEEMALPLNGKKNNLSRKDLIDYYAISYLKINPAVVAAILQEMRAALAQWQTLINRSFLSLPLQQRYLQLIIARSQRLQL